jgi:hypothetical protein
LINGRAYDYTQITCLIAGVPVAGIQSINYVTEQPKVNNFGVGNQPISRGRGPKDPSGSLELDMNEVEAIRDAAPNGDLTEIAPFTITIVFGNLQRPVVHRLRNVEFSNDGVETSQGDTNITRSFDIVMSDVKYRL